VNRQIGFRGYKWVIVLTPIDNVNDSAHAERAVYGLSHRAVHYYGD